MFYITVSNGLLEGNHRKRIGSAVWEFMWLIDKITKIDDEGWGWILGGKPINLKDIKGIHPVNVSKNLTKLEKENYISIQHTPYGMIIKVAKAKKRFNKIIKPEGLAKILNPISVIAKPHNENAKPNKIIQLDNTIDNINGNGQAIAKIINCFKSISPTNYKKWFNNSTQRHSTENLLKLYPYENLENLIVNFLPKINVLPYTGKDCKAFSPYELEKNLDKIKAKIKELKLKSREQKVNISI